MKKYGLKKITVFDIIKFVALYQKAQHIFCFGGKILRIGICDDNAFHRKMVHEWLRANRNRLGVTEIREFDSGENVLGYLNTHSFEILFLDCRMGGMDGISTAREIRKINRVVVLIALTDYKDYALYGYDVDIHNYIMKSEFQSRIEAVFESAARYARNHAAVMYRFRVGATSVKVRVPDIQYLENRLRKVRVYLSDSKVYDFYGKLNEAENELKEHGFIRPHKSYLVNLQYIYKFGPREIELTTETRIPVAESKYRQALDNFTVFSADMRI